MVFVILLQVFFRYVLNNALPWPDEAARFLMLWMTGVAAPLAYRHGSFVSINMLELALPRRPALILGLFLLLLSSAVLITALTFGWKHTTGFAGNFNSASLGLPLGWFDMGFVKMKLKYMYGSLLVFMILMTMVNVELIFRNIISLFRPDLIESDKSSDDNQVLGVS